ncbi:MAG: CHASE2 domain-containing protein, partial [Halieaceae bacterium]
MNKLRLLQPLARLAYSLGFLSRELRTQFFLGLALFFTLFTAAYFFDAVVGGAAEQTLDYDAGTLDMAMEWRLSSPRPSSEIVIIDIDERSLAIMAEEFGRWPWPRSVMADFLAMLMELEPKAVGVNIMYSDADLNDVEGDQIFDEVISYFPNAVFPMTRLSPANDFLSEISVDMLPGAMWEEGGGDNTVSMLFTMFPSAQDRMGLNNLVLDDDGVVRRFQPHWIDEGFSLPSLAYQMSAVANENSWASGSDFPEYLINWRNKTGVYPRVSFVDVYQALLGEGDLNLSEIENKYMVLGLTAPGLAVLKGTAVSSATDDNLIIANSLDDILNDTGLLTLPSWVIALIAIVSFWGIAWCYLVDIDDELIDLGFVIYESIAVFITVGSISFTRYAFDLSYVALTGIAFYTAAFVYDMPAKGSMRATRRFYASQVWQDSTEMVAIAFYDMEDQFQQTARQFQKLLGAKHVYQIDNLFAGESIASEALEPIRVVLVLDPSPVEQQLSELDQTMGVAIARMRRSPDEDLTRLLISESVLRASLSLL